MFLLVDIEAFGELLNCLRVFSKSLMNESELFGYLSIELTDLLIDLPVQKLMAL